MMAIENDMSKIHFESNSQRNNTCGNVNEYWKRYVKDTFWKQFTTHLIVPMFLPLLKTICQRYILKAIHNLPCRFSLCNVIENDMSKIHFESNSQQATMCHLFCNIENDMSKIHFESNSQHWVVGWLKYLNWKRYVKDTFWKQFTTERVPSLLFRLLKTICQRYILKAIHNLHWKAIPHRIIENDMSKIHFESNSQLERYASRIVRIENDMSKIHFESNSQPHL